ncbi:SIS domain-containing protein [Roseobacter ponti]|uniref:SIS domain-containing protein n=1 Tax=Roseobacter ponti TaxID=1891787 RepID=A0A858SMR2_9RHOB|nr:SIS domain-containing protein [Roseobacter ponti]QJF50114.1 SIS domain-containing protein [Roseobacter ponti]
MSADHTTALAEIGTVLDAVDQASVDQACAMLAEADDVLLYGCGREGLQMRGLAMRLYHLGLSAGMVGDMNAPPLGQGDVLMVSAGPGTLSTVTALMQVARRDGARILILTATPGSDAEELADHVLHIPAQTMASDQGPAARSVLPMGSVYEGALFMLFEMMVLDLRSRLGATAEEMRARHTNME